MSRRLALPLLLLFSLMLGCTVSPLRATQVLPDARFERDIDWARTIGPLIYRHDRGTELALSALQRWVSAHRPADGGEQHSMAAVSELHYITEQVDGKGTLRVTFIEDQGARLEPRYIVTVPDERYSKASVQVNVAAGERLSDFELAKYRARKTLLDVRFKDCGYGHDAALFAWQQRGHGDVFYGFAIAKGADGGRSGMLLGFVIAGNGTKIVQPIPELPEGNDGPNRSFGNQCRDLQNESRFLAYASPLAAPSPFDVYRAMALQRPLFVAGDDQRIWRLDGDIVTLLDGREGWHFEPCADTEAAACTGRLSQVTAARR